jgi:predicted 3-demethylubiquinone-9 3-methyltransferase (glyoxalase superfamily)
MDDLRLCLWFNQQAKEAARLYLSLFDQGELLSGSLERTDPEQGEPSFSVISIRLAGTELMLFDAGPEFEFTEAISIFVPCADQAEVDRLWFGLIADGGSEGKCGWLKDRFGVSWQIVPTRLGALLGDPDPARSGATQAAMLSMGRLIVDELEAAHESV